MIDFSALTKEAAYFMFSVWGLVLLCAGYCFIKVIFSKRRLDSDE